MWQKVTKDEHAHYIDFCNGVKVSDRPEIIYKAIKSQGYLTPQPKSDVQSNALRKSGNREFGQKKWSDAMEYYNRSLCCANATSTQSEMLSLAYGNRSAVFFELKKYDKCLVDIDLAKKAGYPKRLLPKLEQRGMDCIKSIENGDQAPQFEPKLSFEPCDKYPEMANVLQIQYSRKYGRHIKAKCDIAVGQTLLIEKVFMTAHRYEGFRRCDSCMKKDVNLIPCSTCTRAMFCSTECSASLYHQVECNMLTMPEESCNDNQLHIIRSLLQAIYIFQTAEELQTFVEDAISSKPTEIPASILDEKSLYRAFLKLWHEPDVFYRNTFSQQVYFVYQTLMENEIIGPKFNSAKKKRFLMHLVAQHYCIINYSGNISFDYSDDLVGWEFNEFRSIITLYVNHSCAPNVNLVSFDGYNVLVTMRPIKSGEQIFLSYFRNDKNKHSTVDRQKYILARCRFHCNCERCNGDAPLTSEQDAMKADECFKYIRRNKYKMNGTMEADAANELEGKCVEWLNKYGQKTWNSEIDEVIDCYRRLLASKFNNVIRF